MPHIVGLTGGIATGKSSVSSLWRAYDRQATIIDADVIAREVVKPGRPAHRLIRSYFGTSVIHAHDGTINRAALGRIIFSDATKRAALNRRIHPFIMLSMLTQLFVAVCVRWRRVVVLDAPLLFESGTLVYVCTKIVVVYAPEDVQLARLMGRNTEMSKEEATNRINSQLSLRKKMDRATHVIDNSGNKDQLQVNARNVWNQIQPSNVTEVSFRAVVCGIVWSLGSVALRLFNKR